ncbi:uncharacterized protein LOC141643013 [Silene latifolia]|uniref:uncharacterized protein LOC141643013 n=1 Tax=Silene latifolia TaxID=37657 RepID=UPI003D78393A
MFVQTISKALNASRKLFPFLKINTFHLSPHSSYSPMAASSPSLKRVYPFSTTSPTHAPLKRVGTHNGSFHCDEALGCFMILLTDKFSDAQIIRTRDPQVLESLDAVLDVGGVYDPSRDRYDHHQKGFGEVFGHGFVTKLSSAGLVYKHFGMEIISKELKLELTHPDVFRLFISVYRNFMEAIDAIDNGINQYDTDKPPRYVNNTSLSSRVGRLNLDWTDPDQSAEKENEAFEKAMSLAGDEFLDNVRSLAKSWLPARSIVVECLLARKDIDPSGEIMVLNRFCPWKLHLFELEEEMKSDPLVKYVVYQDERSKHWRVQAVAVSPDSFESRKPLPEQWRGLRDNELSGKSGIPGGVFVHMSGFIGGNVSYEGALAMAKAALKF